MDCTAEGVRPTQTRQIFEPDRITLQYVTIGGVPWTAATQGAVEALREDDAEKNRLCPPNQYAGDTRGYARNLAQTWRTEGEWLRESDLSAWLGSSRLNLLRAFPDHQAEPRAVDAVTRYLTHVGEAIHRLEGFARG